MIAHGTESVRAELGADLLGQPARDTVNDAAFILVPPQNLQQCLIFFRRPLNDPAEIFAVKAGDKLQRLMQTEQPPDIIAHSLCCGCRKGRNNRSARQERKEFRNLQVARPEILSPLRKTVRLIYGDHRNRSRFRQRQK